MKNKIPKNVKPFKKQIVHTWPLFDVLSLVPAKIVYPLVLAPFEKQWAADKIVFESKIVPPQKWLPYFLMETCQGIAEGALAPPIILFSSSRNLAEFCIQFGTVAFLKKL